MFRKNVFVSYLQKERRLKYIIQIYHNNRKKIKLKVLMTNSWIINTYYGIVHLHNVNLNLMNHFNNIKLFFNFSHAKDEFSLSENRQFID